MGVDPLAFGSHDRHDRGADMATSDTQSAAAVQAEVEAWCDDHWDADLTVGDWWKRLAGVGLDRKKTRLNSSHT